MVLGLYKYVDVNGTDYSAKVMGSDANRKLSDVGTCDVVLNNKGGQYKTTFSEMQRVAVAQGRAAFCAESDFFTGTDGSVPNASKWTVFRSDANQKYEISMNKLYTVTQDAVAGKYVYVLTATSYTPPYTMIFWAETGGGLTLDDSIRIQSSNGEWTLVNIGTTFQLGTKQGGAWAARATSGAIMAATTWYLFVITCPSSTTIRIHVYDVYGFELWDSGVQTMDEPTMKQIQLGTYNTTAAVRASYWDSFLMWSQTTPKGEQVFEGVINKIEFTENPDMVTLHCLDDARELEKQYDETYGRATNTFTPSYQTTDDIGVMTGYLLASGWTYTAPDNAIHDKQTVSINTRRIYALDELLALTPYLGWFVLPMKHFAWVMPDTSPAPDAWTEATAGWVDYGPLAGSLATDINLNVDGSFALYMGGAWPGAGTSGARRGDALNISRTDYRFITLYAQCNHITDTIQVLLWTDIAGSKYWSYNFGGLYNGAGRSWLSHLVVRLPDANGDHGWTPTNSPSGNIQRVAVELVHANAASVSWAFDVLYFSANKKLTSKYTVSLLVSVSRIKSAEFYTRALCAGSGITTKVYNDATAQTMYGLNEILIDDQSITTDQAADIVGRGLLAMQGFDDSGDPIQVIVVNPGDMYNVMLGDTVTITYANMDLSSATRTLIGRRDTFNNDSGWLTTLVLSNDPYRDRTNALLAMSKRKRY